jgi:hypothetical protein
MIILSPSLFEKSSEWLLNNDTRLVKGGSIMQKGFILRTPGEFKTAEAFHRDVEVWREDEMVVKGLVEWQTEGSVVIDGMKFNKGLNKFKLSAREQAAKRLANDER